MSEQNNTQETEEEKRLREAWAVSTTYEYGGSDFKLSLTDIYNICASGTAKPTYKECQIFMKLCETQKLNPFLNEAYLIKYTDKKPAQILVSKDLFEKRAETFPTYDGKESGVIVKRGDEVVELEGAFKLDDDILLGGWCKVYRTDRNRPSTIRVTFDEYVGKKSNGEINQQWSSKPLTMIRKVAVAQGLREAFPKNFEGMYIQDEMDSIQNPTPKENLVNKSRETVSPLEKKFYTEDAVLVESDEHEEITQILQEDDRVEPVEKCYSIIEQTEGKTFAEELEDFERSERSIDGLKD